MHKRTIVIKIGSRLLTTPTDQTDLNNLRQLCKQIAEIKSNHPINVCIVSSGAIVSGQYYLSKKPSTIPEKQAAAAIGQPALFQEYSLFLKQLGLNTAQLLLTRDGLDNHERQTHTKNTIHTLFEHNVIPIINENDSVAIEELTFGDNDGLSSKLATLISAETLILLTDTNGVYTENPSLNPNATLIELLPNISDEQIANTIDNLDARGGMKSKLLAAKNASQSGINVYITNGRKSDSIVNILNNINPGTFVPKNDDNNN